MTRLPVEGSMATSASAAPRGRRRLYIWSAPGFSSVTKLEPAGKAPNESGNAVEVVVPEMNTSPCASTVMPVGELVGRPTFIENASDEPVGRRAATRIYGVDKLVMGSTAGSATSAIPPLSTEIAILPERFSAGASGP